MTYLILVIYVRRKKIRIASSPDGQAGHPVAPQHPSAFVRSPHRGPWFRGKPRDLAVLLRLTHLRAFAPCELLTTAGHPHPSHPRLTATPIPATPISHPPSHCHAHLTATLSHSHPHLRHPHLRHPISQTPPSLSPVVRTPGVRARPL